MMKTRHFQKSDWGILLSAVLLSQVPYSIAAPGLSDDGRPDLGLANLNHGTLSTLLGRGEGRALSYAAGGGPNSARVSGFDRNGDSDPPVVNEGEKVLTEHARPQLSSGQPSVVNTDSSESSKAERRIETLTTRPLQWYRDAAAQGSLEAVFILGWFYHHVRVFLEITAKPWCTTGRPPSGVTP
jgi:hypothetical protein